MKKLIRETAEEILQEYTNCYSDADEDCLVKMIEKLASNVAREIFAEIESRMMFVKDHTGDIRGVVTIKDIAELRKKYESEGEDDEN